ncbi:putative MscS family protein [Escovopsis weberi]|uniref:Putative MscS family protein n=1 Tax=Escovopsis weberi TaxID=150374 RepID=A0A0M8MZQ1_ESCWE|nr:putative MscS family protein [Escovopsis weberi]
MTDIPLDRLSTVRSNVSTGVRKQTAITTSRDSEHNEKQSIRNRHAGRRRKLDDEPLRRRGTGDEVKLNAMGRFYAKVIGFSLFTRYLVYVVPVGILLAIPLIVLAATDHKHDIFLGDARDKNGDIVTEGPPLFKLFLWIEISWLALWGVKMVAWPFPKVFMFFCGIVSAGTRKYATVLENIIITISLFFWALASWLTFKNLFSQAYNADIAWVVGLERVLGACFAASAVLLGEKAIVQLIGVSYHQRSFANRIKDSKREIHLLGLLYDASRTLFPMYCTEFAEEDYIIEDSIEMMLRRKAGRGSSSGGAATPMKLISGIGHIGDKVTSVFGNIATEITGKQVFNPNSAHTIVIEALEKKKSSEALARRIWTSFAVEGRDALFPDDIEEVLGPAYKKEAEEAFECIDTDANGDISLDEMVRKVVEMGHERKAIAEGMKDIGQALQAFDKVLLFVVLLITVFIFLSFFRSSFLTTVATAGTALLSLSFVFAVTTQEFLGSCIFLFVKHPYDVGDRIEITGVQMIVERISLLYTVFTRTDKMQIVQAMSESFQVDISYDTSFEDVELLRMEMENFVRSPENCRDFQPDFTIGVGGVGNLDKLVLNMSIKHKSNWHNERVRAMRRSKFMCALAVALKKVPIYGPSGSAETLGGPRNPTYSVSVTDQWAAASRGEADAAKEAKRMVPTVKNALQARETEKTAILELNSRHPEPIDTSCAWDAREDQSVISARDHSADAARFSHLGSVKGELPHRESQRGRRRAGEGLSPAFSPSDAAHHGLPPSPSNPRIIHFDEEAQTGMPPTLGGHGNQGELASSSSSYRARVSDVGETDERALHPTYGSQRGPTRGQSLGRRHVESTSPGPHH